MASIVVYYSLEGSTKLIAENVSKELSGDLLELKPVKEEVNPKSFLKFFWGGRQVMQKKKPALEPFSADLEKYSLIVIGTPVWAFTYTPAIRSFLSIAKIKDKKLAFFCCHEGTPGKTLDNLEKELPGNTVIGKKAFLNVFADKMRSSANAREWAAELKEAMKR